MVSRDSFSEGAFKPCPVLTDVTNRPSKRPFSSISDDGGGNSQFAKQVCLGVDNMFQKKSQLQMGEKNHHLNNDSDKVVLHHPSLNLPIYNAVPNTSLLNPSQNSNLLGGGCSVVPNLTANSLRFREEGQEQHACGVSEGRTLSEGFSNSVSIATQSDKRDLCVVGNLASSKGGAMEPPTISASHDSRFPGLERCTTFKGVGSSSVNPVVADADLLKTCNCSFCTKAAYIWSDLHYQDVKGRISVIKKSQKEASAMVQKFSAVKDAVMLGQQSSSGSSKLELDLSEQWKSLFLNMENKFAQENKQLESNFEALKGLRDNCKKDLDLTDTSHFDKH